MSDSIQPFLVEDSRLFVTDILNYGVCISGESILNSVQPATNSSTTSNVVVNVIVPSLDTIVSNSCFIEYDLELVCSMSSNGGGALQQIQQLQYGYNFALCPYPLQRNCSTVSCQINSSKSSIDMYQNFDILSRTFNSQFQSKSNFANNCLDNYRHYYDAVGATNSPFADYTSSQQLSSQPPGRGALNLSYLTTTSPPTDGTFTFTDTGAALTFYVKAHIFEQVLISPFNFDADISKRGLRGINQMNFQFQLNSVKNRVISNGITTNGVNPRAITVTTMRINNAKMHFDYIQLHASQLSRMPTSCVVPYYQITDLQKNFSTTGTTYTCTFDNIQLNAIPDRVLIGLRYKQLDSYLTSDSDSFMPITDIKVTFNGVGGILSTASRVDLYEMTVFNAVFQNWNQWSGISVKTQLASLGVTPNIYTCGPVLCLNFFSDVYQANAYSAPGSIGNYNFQIQINGTLPLGPETLTCQGNMLIETSGYMKFENGLSTQMLGILTQEAVLEISKNEVPVQGHDVRRLIGSGFWDSLRGVVSKILPIAQNVVAPMLQQSGVPQLQKAGQFISTGSDVLKNLTGGTYSGLGMSGGQYSVSGLGVSGEKKMRRHKLL